MHPYDRLKRERDKVNGLNVLSYCNEKAQVWYNTNKTNGPSAMSWSRAIALDMPVTWLVECGNCGKVSTPKKVQYRSDCFGWNIDTKYEYKKAKKNLKGYLEYYYSSHAMEKSVLCMGCWNKIKPIMKAKNEAEEINTLKNKLNKERLKWLKSQTQAN